MVTPVARQDITLPEYYRKYGLDIWYKEDYLVLASEKGIVDSWGRHNVRQRHVETAAKKFVERLSW
uniref:Uncharacterized protein n=1 Tax=viral metagenome TaxID=1070528 RepID=A0A6M3LLP5_9ZZZZ